MKKKVLALSCFPMRMPLFETATLFLVVDRFQSPEWVWGAVGVFVVLLWCAFIYDRVTTEEVDILNPKKEK